MDDETLAYIKERVAAEAQLPDGWSERLEGGTLAALRADAAELARTLGVAEPEPVRERDAAGRFASASMNARIRSAVRGDIVVPAREPEPPVDGTLGAGRGGVVPAPAAQDMNALIRQASGRT